MTILKGQGVSEGIQRGEIRFFRRKNTGMVQETAEDAALELRRLRRALDLSVRQLEETAKQTRVRIGDSAAALFEAHAMMAADEEFVRTMQTLIRQGKSAEFAVRQAGERFAQLLGASDDAYLRGRAADIRDVAHRIVENLLGVWEEKNPAGQEHPVILAAEELSPSETIRLDPAGILAIAVQNGSPTSHTAILARTLGIPAVCGLGPLLNEASDGLDAWIDGETGELVIEPDEEMCAEFEKRRKGRERRSVELKSLVGKEDVTQDGQKMLVYCNISSPGDVSAVLENDGRGIGLFRSEYLYLGRSDLPGEEEQFEAYREVAQAMQGRRVIVRTLDAGADKKAESLGLPPEENPALGMRAVRVCLSRPELFRTQLRALYRASAYGKISVMFPMIASVWELEECLAACRCVQEELRAEGRAFDEHLETGVMIETPAAVLIADELAARVNFFSVGTNDLTQYLLACDRQRSDLGRHWDPHHPAVLRALRMTAQAAHKAGIWVGICGELAADLSMLPDFLSMGIDELSVPAAFVLPLRAAIRSHGKKDS